MASSQAKEIGKRVRQLRKEAGLTQEALATKANISTNTLARIERGVQLISNPSLLNLSKALGVKASSILDA